MMCCRDVEPRQRPSQRPSCFAEALKSRTQINCISLSKHIPYLKTRVVSCLVLKIERDYYFFLVSVSYR